MLKKEYSPYIYYEPWRRFMQLVNILDEDLTERISSGELIDRDDYTGMLRSVEKHLAEVIQTNSNQ